MAISNKQARTILKLCSIDPALDFHTLGEARVSMLVVAAKQLRYRKPRNANGSMGRYFHAMLVRKARRAG